MEANDPQLWSIPNGWHEDWDSKWELDQLRAFAMELIARSNSHHVMLDIFDEGYLRVNVFFQSIKIGEVFVCRTPNIENSALFSLFLGSQGNEDYALTIAGAVDCVLQANESLRK